MTELHQLLHNHQWEEIQNAIRADATVSMRISDCPEEDMWFDTARRKRAEMEGIDISSICNNLDEEVAKADNDAQEVDEQQDEGEGQMQLRYWVEPHDANILNIDAGIRAANDLLQKRTLLHSLCRMTLASNEALVVQLTHGDSDGLQTLVGAVKTAKMLIDASHNCTFLTNGDTSSKGADVVKIPTKCSSKCNNCPCHMFQHYCPPMALPPVENPQSTNSANTNNYADGDQTNLQYDDNVKEDDEKEKDFILHTSVLTMPDATGNTPLHSLAGEGSIHIDLVRVILDSCRPVDEEMNLCDVREPTVHDLFKAQNYHGCTPLHFLAGEEESVDTLSILLNECNTPPGDIPATMISDNDGDLPLHYSACCGASSAQIIRILAMEAPQSTLVKNNLGRLAIDDYIEWYIDSGNDNEDIRSDSSEAEGDSDDSESSSSTSSNESEMQSIDDNLEHQLVPPFMSGLFKLRRNWKNELWSPIYVLVEAAVAAIFSRNGSEQSNTRGQLLPIHAAVVACKYAHFPALALHTTVLRSDGDINFNTEITKPLLKEDLFGYLPLRWACGDIPSLLSFDTSNDDHVDKNKLVTSKHKQLARFNTYTLPHSMIEYLMYVEPAAARRRTRDGRLPLHLLVEDGSSSWDDITLLLKEYPESLVEQDAVSKLYPFLVAAASSSKSSSRNNANGLIQLENTFRLIMEDPSLLCQLIESIGNQSPTCLKGHTRHIEA